MTGEECYARLEPHLPAAMSMFSTWAQSIALDMAVSNERGRGLHAQLRQRVIAGSEEHGFEYWKNPPAQHVLLDDADEELLDAIVYFAIWYMQRGRTI